MEKDYEVPFAEILVTYDRMMDSLDDEVDARVVFCSCLMLIAKCNIALGINPTQIDGVERMARPIVLEYMEVFRKKGNATKKLKK